MDQPAPSRSADGGFGDVLYEGDGSAQRTAKTIAAALAARRASR
jgi:hypothetical protein